MRSLIFDNSVMMSSVIPSRKYVRPAIERFAAGLLRGHPVGGADNVTILSQLAGGWSARRKDRIDRLGSIHPFGHSEIEQLGLTAAADHDVARLDVAMDDSN